MGTSYPAMAYTRGPYVTVRDITREVIGLRLNATNNSLYALAGTLADYAHLAVVDAFAQYPITITDMYYTLTATVAAGVMTVPRDVYSISSMHDLTEDRPYPHYTFMPTHNTKMVRLEAAVSTATQFRVRFTKIVDWVPRDTTLSLDSYPYQLLTTFAAGAPGTEATFNDWPGRGHISITANASSLGNLYEELVRYGTRTIDGAGETGGPYIVFGDLVRQLYGRMPDQAYGWKNIYRPMMSFAIMTPRATILPIALQAQANMYSYWLADRAAYDQYTAIASRQFYTQEELLTLIHSLEGRASLRFNQAQKNLYKTKPTGRIRLRRPLPK